MIGGAEFWKGGKGRKREGEEKKSDQLDVDEHKNLILWGGLTRRALL